MSSPIVSAPPVPGLRIRQGRTEDREELIRLWQAVFGDRLDYIKGFFASYGQPDHIMTGWMKGQLAAAIYQVPMGGMSFPDGSLLPASITYALAAWPQFRNRGIGSAVMRAAIQTDFDRGFVCNSLCPAEDSLFPYYTARIGYRDCFYLREICLLTGKVPEGRGSLHPAGAEEYNNVRNHFLRGGFFMQFDTTGICYQQRLCADTGGGLFLLDTPAGSGCAACEYAEDGTLLVQELLCPEEALLWGMGLLVSALPAPALRVRTPAFLGESLGGQVRRYGQMLCRDGDTSFARLTGYYGFGFD